MVSNFRPAGEQAWGQDDFATNAVQEQAAYDRCLEEARRDLAATAAASPSHTAWREGERAFRFLLIRRRSRRRRLLIHRCGCSS